MDSGRLVVIGGSAGGVPALMELVGALPADFPAPVCVVIHIGANHSILPELLNGLGAPRAVHARDGDFLEAGRIYVAPPDRHMLVVNGVLRLSRAAKENHTRPAVDPLFRTAAVHWREGVIGIILSGQLDDGIAGLVAIKECGGMAYVQDPATALNDDMPRYALATVAVDGVFSPSDMATELARDARPGRYRCHTGHSYTSLALESAQAEFAGGALWAAVRALREREMLLRRLAHLARSTGDEKQAAAGEAKASRVHTQVQALSRILDTESMLEPTPAA